MAGVIYTVIVAVPMAVGLIRARQWLAGQLAGSRGWLWSVLGGLGIGMLPALVAGTVFPASWAAWQRHGGFTVLALPALAAAWFLLRQRQPAHAEVPTPTAAPAAAATEPAPATPVAEQTPEPLAVAPPPSDGLDPKPAAASLGKAAASAKPATPAEKVTGPAVPRPAAKTRHDADGRSVVEASPRATPPPAPVTAAAGSAAASPPPTPRLPSAGKQEAPTTVTECVLSMSISCEEYILQNFVQMAQAPLPEPQRETIRRLVEETDDKLARLRAARYRHHGEEVVRVTWSQLPEVDLPVVQPGATVEQVREKAVRQTQVMIDFYRTVAAYVQRPSLKSLLVNLALDGQRHLAVIEQTAP